jgi:hypothetical protein
MRLRQASSADALAERAIAEFDAEASEIRARIEATEDGAGKAGPE